MIVTPVVTMTNWQYWSRWGLAGAAFLAALYFVVKAAIIAALITVSH